MVEHKDGVIKYVLDILKENNGKGISGHNLKKKIKERAVRSITDNNIRCAISVLRKEGYKIKGRGIYTYGEENEVH